MHAFVYLYKKSQTGGICWVNSDISNVSCCLQHTVYRLYLTLLEVKMLERSEWLYANNLHLTPWRQE